MAQRQASGASRDSPGHLLDGGFWLVVILAAACLGLVLAAGLRGLTSSGSGGGSGATGATGAPGGPGAVSASPRPSVYLTSFLYPTVADAPPIALTDPSDQPATLASMRGGIVLVFFGYTHCPDVCPATIGLVEQVMATYGAGIRTLFVTVDPERDSTIWLKQFDSYRSPQFTSLTGSDDQIRATADAWNVKYARVETGVPGEYSMSHTADVFAVDAEGLLRAHFPFGTTAAEMLATLRLIESSEATTAPTQAPTAAAGVPAAGGLQVEVDSTSVWAGGPSPVILALSGPAGRLNDTSIRPVVTLTATHGTPVGSPVAAIAVLPPGLGTVSYVAAVTIPTPGWWHLAVSATPGSMTLSGIGDVAALDPG